jgi:outer membrane protein OmpA-like peptidoglycan-associated protein
MRSKTFRAQLAQLAFALLTLPLVACTSNQQASQCYPVATWAAPAFRCATAAAPEPVAPIAEPVAEPARVELTADTIDLKERVQFENASDVLLDASKTLLDEVAKTIQAHPELVKIRIEGHTDKKAGTGYNQKLSERRAASVRAYLIEQGIDGGRLEAKGFGESRPIADNSTPEGREQNRRVELHIVEHAR